MLRPGRFIGLVTPLIFIFLFAVFIPEKSVVAAENKSPTGGETVVTDKVSPLERSTLPVEKQDAVKKPQIIKKTALKPDKHQETTKNINTQENLDNKLEVEQDIMEKALELLNNSQELWVNGEIEYALDALDQAYAILLDVNGDADMARQKDDLRLLISKKILAIYTSRQSITSGRRSEIPIVMNAEVEREIHSFQTVERDFFIQAYQRAAFFRPVVVTALKRAGLPEELSWLPLVESGFKIRALSRARALGLWQFIPSTGYKYGLNRDDWVDERMDVEKSTQAAIGYMKDLHDMFGDWLTVLAGYNCGEGRVLRVISGQHINYLDRFWDLYKQLPNETARYVPRFLATLHIIKDPKKYGMDLAVLQAEKQPAFVYAKVKTSRIMNLQDIALRLDVSEEHLSTLNAELRLKKTPDKDYSLKVPPESLDKFAQVIDEIPLAEKPRAEESRRPATVTVRHKVKAGETIASVANRYRTTTGAIRKQNRFLAKSNLKVGQALVVAVGDSRTVKTTENRESSADKSGVSNVTVPYKVKRGDTIFSLAKQFEMGVDEIRKINNIKSSTLKVGQKLKLDKKAPVDDEDKKKVENRFTKRFSKGEKGEQPVKNNQGKAKTYVVKKGDTLQSIAQINGANVGNLRNLNNLINKNAIQTGQVLELR